MSLNDINQMSLLERMHLMEQLWDSFKKNEDELPSPMWHDEILNERRKCYDNGEISTLTLDELKASFNR